MSNPEPNAPQKSPLATPEPWDLVRDGYVSELWDHFSVFAKHALDFAAPAPGADVLDVCTGPGTLALQAAKSARRVVGVDFSPLMLEELRRRAGESGASNVEVLEADGQALPLPDASFDAAFSMFGLIFFPERDRGFRELHRVLRPGGRALVASWVPFDRIPPLQAVFQILGELMPDIPFGKNKAPLGDPAEVRAEFAATGFQDVEVREATNRVTAPNPTAFWISVERSTAPLVLLRRRLGEPRWQEISEELRTNLTTRFGDAPFDIEFTALLGRGTRP